MLKKTIMIGCASLAVLLQMALAAEAKPLVRRGTGLEETIECQGRAVLVEGASNRLEVLGRCPELTVKGADNLVKVERVGLIRMDGAGNQVLWLQAIGRKKPRLLGATATNEIRRITEEEWETVDEEPFEEETKPLSDIIINDTNVEKTVTCRGESVIINGNHNRVRLLGVCAQVSINGSRHDVQIDKVASISINGSDSKIGWREAAGRQKEPAISVNGNNDIYRMK